MTDEERLAKLAQAVALIREVGSCVTVPRRKYPTGRCSRSWNWLHSGMRAPKRIDPRDFGQ